MARPRRRCATCGHCYLNPPAFVPLLPSMSLNMRSSPSYSAPDPGEPRETTFNIHHARNSNINRSNDSSASSSSSPSDDNNGGDDDPDQQQTTSTSALSSLAHRNRTKSKILLTRLVPPSILRNQSTSQRRPRYASSDAMNPSGFIPGGARGRARAGRRRGHNSGTNISNNYNYSGKKGGDYSDAYSSSGSIPAASGSMINLPTLYSVEEAKNRTDMTLPANNATSPHTYSSFGDTVDIERALQGGPLKTFIFHGTEAGLFGGILGRRRSGDPPLRQLNVSYGTVHERSMPKKSTSNPRIHGELRGWYINAIKQGVLDTKKPKDREKLALSTDRLVLRPGNTIDNNNITNGDNANTGTTVTNRREKRVIPPKRGVPNVATSQLARSLGESPRLIVIGDIHGCIDEFRALLRLASFSPGDQVILLGDLVAKGPDSLGVVQLAREINARSVRGNHDHEVIRWFEANTRGGADAVVSLEHARIARSLSHSDHAWLMDSPWFIEYKDIDHLFVHAGFIPGVKLTQQNPRLMMNMRSVLDDGTVTAKNVPHCAWARLWRGPQTVVFGHDAFRGLQQYEFAKGIDTGCVYGGRLTALLLPENRFISVPAKRAYVSSKRFRSRESARKAKIQLFDPADTLAENPFIL